MAVNKVGHLVRLLLSSMVALGVALPSAVRAGDCTDAIKVLLGPPDQLGQALPAERERPLWQPFASGWRFPPNTDGMESAATETYGRTFREYVEKAKKAATFEEFIGHLEAGARAAGKSDNFGKRRTEDEDRMFLIDVRYSPAAQQLVNNKFTITVDSRWLMEMANYILDHRTQNIGKRKTASDVKIRLGGQDLVTLQLSLYMGCDMNLDTAPKQDLMIATLAIAVEYRLQVEHIPKVFARLKELYQIAANDPDRLKRYMATVEFGDLLRKTVPYVRGTSGIADAATIALFEKMGIKVGRIQKGFGFDLWSWSTPDLMTLIRRYAGFFF